VKVGVLMSKVIQVQDSYNFGEKMKMVLVGEKKEWEILKQFLKQYDSFTERDVTYNEFVAFAKGAYGYTISTNLSNLNKLEAMLFQSWHTEQMENNKLMKVEKQSNQGNLGMNNKQIHQKLGRLLDETKSLKLDDAYAADRNEINKMEKELLHLHKLTGGLNELEEMQDAIMDKLESSIHSDDETSEEENTPRLAFK
jgi:hypothetical protein